MRLKGIAMKLLVGTMALAMLVAGLSVNATQATAAGTLTERSATLSSAAASATSVTARVSFKVTTTNTVQSVEIGLPQFAGGSPAIVNPSNIAGTSASTTGSGATYKVFFNNTSASITAGTTVAFTVSGLTNPSSTGNQTVTIKTWTSPSGAGTNIDTGTTLVAIVTNASAQLTATVAEALTGSVGSGSISLSVDPSGTAFELASGYAVAVASNAKNGVTTAVSISGALQGVAYGSGAQIAAEAGTFASPTSNTGKPTVNKWGINADGTSNTWAGPTTSGATISGLTTSGPTNSVSQTHVVGVNVDYTTPADTYTTTIYYVFTPNF